MSPSTKRYDLFRVWRVASFLSRPGGATIPRLRATFSQNRSIFQSGSRPSARPRHRCQSEGPSSNRTSRRFPRQPSGAGRFVRASIGRMSPKRRGPSRSCFRAGNIRRTPAGIGGIDGFRVFPPAISDGANALRPRVAGEDGRDPLGADARRKLTSPPFSLSIFGPERASIFEPRDASGVVTVSGTQRQCQASATSSTGAARVGPSAADSNVRAFAHCTSICAQRQAPRYTKIRDSLRSSSPRQACFSPSRSCSQSRTGCQNSPRRSAARRSSACQPSAFSRRRPSSGKRSSRQAQRTFTKAHRLSPGENASANMSGLTIERGGFDARPIRAPDDLIDRVRRELEGRRVRALRQRHSAHKHPKSVQVSAGQVDRSGSPPGPPKGPRNAFLTALVCAVLSAGPMSTAVEPAGDTT